MSTPLLSQVIALFYPFVDPGFDGLKPMKPAQARALGGLVLTGLFGLKVYYVHWAGAGSANKKKDGVIVGVKKVKAQ
jgi:hypothetical protein